MSMKLLVVQLHIRFCLRLASIDQMQTWPSCKPQQFKQQLIVDSMCFAVLLAHFHILMETVAGGMAQTDQTCQPHWSPLTWWQPWLHPTLTILAAVAGAALILHCISSCSCDRQLCRQQQLFSDQMCPSLTSACACMGLPQCLPIDQWLVIKVQQCDSVHQYKSHAQTAAGLPLQSGRSQHSMSTYTYQRTCQSGN